MTTTGQLTLEEFLARPETKPASEYACGEAYQKPMPDNAHGALQLFLGMLLFQFAERTGLGRVRTEWRCIIGPRGRRRTYVPDIVYLSYQRVPAGDLFVNRYVQTAPDLVVEVLSPDQSASRFARKIQFYLRHGVRLVWAVDPAERTITVFSPGKDELVLRPGDTLDGADVLPGFHIAVVDIMARLKD
ncbi:MAG: Uma2 family endonuclease [Chloroflexi bacterium]|nr:Uma2 family endonuclease [Chloroflexota bacterium]